MEIRQWINHAISNGYIIKEEDIMELETNKPYAVVQVDYIRFLASDYPKEYNIEKGKTYSAMDLYGKIKDIIIPLDKGSYKKIYYHSRRNGGVVEGEVKTYIVTLYPHKYNAHDVSLHKIEDDVHLTSGSGDGVSRWMLWDNVAKMPDVFIQDAVAVAN